MQVVSGRRHVRRAPAKSQYHITHVPTHPTHTHSLPTFTLRVYNPSPNIKKQQDQRAAPLRNGDDDDYDDDDDGDDDDDDDVWP